MMTRTDPFAAWRLERSREALIALLESSQATVYNLCFQVLRHPQDAEDASQRVFLDLLGALPQLTNLDHYRAWLHRACLLTALNYRRGERRRMRYEKVPRTSVPAPLSNDDRAYLHEHLAHLDDRDRSLLVDHYLEQRTLEDLARVRGCSTVAVWKQVRKAREALERSLQRAGLASLAVAVGAFLSSSRVEAVRDALLSKGILAKAAPGAGEVAPAPPGISGGSLTTLKMTASIAAMLLLVGSLVGYTFYHKWQISRDDAERAAARKSRGVTALLTRGSLPSAGGDDQVVRPDAEERVARFDSFTSFWAAFRKACAAGQDKDRWREWRWIGLRRSDDQFCAIMARLRLKNSLRRAPEEALRFILRDWMESDSQGVATFLGGMPLAKNPTQWDSWSMAKPSLEEWSLQDPGSVLVLLKLLPSDWPIADTVGETRWRLRLKSDPKGFLEWLRTEAAGEDRDNAMKVAIPYWSSRDPLGAAAWVEQLPPEVGKGPLGEIAREWAGSSPEAALGWARKYLERPEDRADRYLSIRSVVLTGLLRGAVRNDPEWAAEAALRWGGGDTYYSSAVLKEWVARDVAGLARFLEQGKLTEARLEAETIDKVSGVWARTDPKSALAWLQRLPEGATRGSCFVELFSTWVTAEDASPPEIYEVAGTLPERLRATAVNGLVGGWSQYDPAAAARFIDAIPPGGTKPTTVSTLLSAWAPIDLEASVAWVRTMPAEIRDPALRDATLRMALSWDVAKAMTLAAEISDLAMRRDAQAFVLEFGAIYQPQAAAAVLATIPDPGSKAFGQVRDGFMARDPVAGLAWAQTLPEVYREMPSAHHPLTKPFDHRLRADITRDILLSYSRRDAEAATRWIEQASIPAATKDVLLAEIRKQRP